MDCGRPIRPSTGSTTTRATGSMQQRPNVASTRSASTPGKKGAGTNAGPGRRSRIAAATAEANAAELKKLARIRRVHRNCAGVV